MLRRDTIMSICKSSSNEVRIIQCVIGEVFPYKWVDFSKYDLICFSRYTTKYSFLVTNNRYRCLV